MVSLGKNLPTGDVPTMSLRYADGNHFSVPKGNSPRGEEERFLKERLPLPCENLLECLSSPHFAAAHVPCCFSRTWPPQEVWLMESIQVARLVSMAGCLTIAFGCWQNSTAPAAESEPAKVARVAENEAEPLEDAIDAIPAERPRLPAPVHAVLLVPPTEPDRVWVDKKKRSVIVDGYVSLQDGYLEMFACIVGTKEHEAVVALESKAFLIHTGLLAVGAKPGSTAMYLPELRPVLALDFFFSDIATAYSTPQFFPPTGSEIEVTVHWIDQEGVWQQARAQEWVIDGNTEKPMTQPWVFAGSGFWTDEQTGKQHYLAESGDVICVSNFTTAMIDVPIESSQSNDGLIFMANPKKVPPIGTPVRVVLTPKVQSP